MVDSAALGAPPSASQQIWYGVDYTVDLQTIRRKMVELDANTAPVFDKPEAYGLRGHSERAGVSHMTWRRLLSGERIQLSKFNRITSYLGLSFDAVASAAREPVAA